MRLSAQFAITAALLTAVTGCSSHHKPKPVPVSISHPPEMSQTPLYSPQMSAQNPPLPDVPGTKEPTASPAPPAQPEPRKKPVHHVRPAPAKPAPENTAAARETAPSSTPPATAAGSSNSASTGSADGKAADTPPLTQQAVVKTPAEPETAASPIGQITAGTTGANIEDPGEMKRETVDMIQSSQKGLNDLRRALSSDEKKVITQIRSFLQQAQRALDNGDTDGAHTLATKAKVMLDELTAGS